MQITALLTELPGNHVIARQSHEATAISLRGGTDAAGRSPHLRVEAVSHDHGDEVWNHLRPQDCIDEALMESFPASDSPSYTACHV